MTDEEIIREYRKNHYNCFWCKWFRFYDCYPNGELYKCELKDINIEKWPRLRATLCDYYRPKEKQSEVLVN